MRSFSLVYAVMLAAGLVACSREKPAAPQPAAKPAVAPAAVAEPSAKDIARAREAELMRAVFGDRYDAAKREALAMIPVDGADQYHRMTVSKSGELPDGSTILIVNGSPSDESGSDAAAHASGGMLNVYILKREGEHWQVVRRHENVEQMGSSGEIGGVKLISLAPGKPGFIVSSGGVWQGYWISSATIYAVEAEVRSLGGFDEGSGNSGACGPETSECWEIQSTIRWVDEPQQSGYRDMLVDFDGERNTATEGKRGDSVERVQTKVHQTARYHFDGKTYVLVSGENPVPGV